MRTEWSWKRIPYMGMHKETPGPKAKGPKWVGILATIVGYAILFAVFLWLIGQLGGGTFL